MADVGSSWMLRAAAAPSLFLTRGFASWVSSNDTGESSILRTAHGAHAPAATAREARRKTSKSAASSHKEASHPNAKGTGTRGSRMSRVAAKLDGEIVLPRDLEQFLSIAADRSFGDWIPLAPAHASKPRARLVGRRRVAAEQNFFVGLVTEVLKRHRSTSSSTAAERDARRTARASARLLAWLAGAVPFGETRTQEYWVQIVGDAQSPARGVVATVSSTVPAAPRLVARDVSTFALQSALRASAEAGEGTERAHEILPRLPAPGVAEQEAVRAAFERAHTVVDLIVGSDRAIRRAAKKLVRRPFDVPPALVAQPARRTTARARKARDDRPAPLAFGAIVEAFFRTTESEFRQLVAPHLASADRLVADTARVLSDIVRASAKPRTVALRELVRRRSLALRAARSESARPHDAAARLELTRRLVGEVDASLPAHGVLHSGERREEALLALANHGDPSIVPVLVARAVTGDVSAVDMLARLGDTSSTGPLVDLLGRESAGPRELDTAIVRALGALGDPSVGERLRALLVDNPMTSWRDGLTRGPLVRELAFALGALRHEGAGPALLALLDGRSEEYRAILPTAAFALGRIRHLPALPALERLLGSPKDASTCEAIWAVGEIGAAHPSAREATAALLEGLPHMEADAEIVRRTALLKIRGRGTKRTPRVAELRTALERALWEPAFRQEETSRRRVWALRSLTELATLLGDRPARSRTEREAEEQLRTRLFPLGHDAIRYFVTRDDHRVRHAAEEAFAAWNVPVPHTRAYHPFVLDALEQSGGLDALHDALRDPLGVFRHNVATRLSELGHPASVRPLAEATARLFAEPPTSTYEYDDAPSHLVAFVRALAHLNQREGNDVLIEGLRRGNHHVRGVVAENAPADERFIPELMAMLGDPRSFLRSRAERSLAALGVRRGNASESPPRLVEV